MVVNTGYEQTQIADSRRGQARADAELARGTIIGRYVILFLLGAGGMGLVYAAYDPELDRKVALKLLQPETTYGQGDEGRKRLVREAQALARLSHPNIVAVHDVGEWAGSVWIAMEFVDGETFSHWLRRPACSWGDKIKILLDIGQGIAAAHAAGLIHRDLKPDNIMVGVDGRVRVMDFGLARPRKTLDTDLVSADTAANDSKAQPALAALALSLTQNGAVVGTPAYMALEQFRGQETDTPADIFSFCAIAWETLYGDKAYAGTSLLELVASLINGKPRPPPVHTKVPGRVRRILERGLLPEPERRWPNMEALLSALGQEPRNSARRKTIIGALALVGVPMIILGLVYRQQANEAIRQRVFCESADEWLGDAWSEDRQTKAQQAILATGLPYAADTWDRARERIAAYAGQWVDASIETCLAGTVSHSLSPRAYQRRVTCLERQQVEFDALTATLATADAKVVEQAVKASVSLPVPARCADARVDDEYVTNDPVKAAEIEQLRKKLARARAHAATGRYVNAAIEARSIGSLALSAGDIGLSAEALGRCGIWEEAAGDFRTAASTLGDAYFLAEQAGRDPLRAEIATTLVSVVGARLARSGEGLSWLRQAEAINTRLGLGGEPRSRLLSAEYSLHFINRDLERSRQVAKENISLTEKLYGIDDVRVATAQVNMGGTLFTTGDYAGAETHTRRALQILEDNLGSGHPDLAPTLNNLAAIAERQGRFDEAGRMYSRAVSIREMSFGSNHPGIAISLTNAGVIQLRTGDPVSAEATFKRAAQIFESAHGDEHPFLASALSGLCRSLIAQGRFDEARTVNRKVHAISRAGQILAGYPEVDLANLELAAGNSNRAIGPAMRALELRSTAKAEERAEAMLALSRALWLSGQDRTRAVTLADDAVNTYRTAGDGFKSEGAAAEAWRLAMDTESRR